MTTDYAPGHRPSQREWEYENWLAERQREAQQRDLALRVYDTSVEMIDRDGRIVEVYDYESWRDHPARHRS